MVSCPVVYMVLIIAMMMMICKPQQDGNNRSDSEQKCNPASEEKNPNIAASVVYLPSPVQLRWELRVVADGDRCPRVHDAHLAAAGSGWHWGER